MVALAATLVVIARPIVVQAEAPQDTPPGSAASTPRVSSAVGDPVRGKTVYQACLACHSLDDDDVGPRHRGVVGRAAGSVAGYPYSSALRHSGLVWDPPTLDRWLTNPQALVPGAKMFFNLKSAQDRADVIAYLAEQR